MPAPPPRADARVLDRLVERGVVVPAPEQVFLAADVRPDAIAPFAVLQPGCRLVGEATRVDEGAVVGAAGPATLENAWVGRGALVGSLGPVTLRDTVAGPGTVLGCGVAEGAVFLGKEVTDPDFTTGYGFRVRKGSLYEEDANSAQHTDTKMTVLFPWVTLGSNINWCDVLVAGGTGPGLGAFTEVGSGAVHFNFTPRGDKATGSLLGDVVEGVFLRAPRLFLGGNVSLLGPAMADYGAVTPAGGRHAGHLHPGLNAPLPPPDAEPAAHYDLGVYGSLRRIVALQVRMVGELAALDAWYGGVRAHLARGRPERAELYARGRAVVRQNLAERVKHLGLLAARVEASVTRLEARKPDDPRLHQHRAFLSEWPQLERHLLGYEALQEEPPAVLLQGLEEAAAQAEAYTAVIQCLPETAVVGGRGWLGGIAGRVADATLLEAVAPAL